MFLNFLISANAFLWNKVVLWLLLFTGIFFTVYLRFVQVRFFKQALKALIQRSRGSKQQISSFQALCTSLAQRVGTGNLAGVATAITYGGEGAIFWMWMTAIVGSSTAFAESTLAQVFKLKKADGSFYGGPAYYIHAGLKSKLVAAIFSIFLVIALGFVFNGVQSNTIAQGLFLSFGISPLYCGVFLALFSGMIIFGGKQRIARIAEILVPFMALSYLAITLYVIVIHFNELPNILFRIVSAAFNSDAAVGGLLGHGIKEAFRYGVARGLFSNEAGFGTAPNAAATAHVSHPVQQGLVQMIAVYIDTLLICTSTAALILLAKDVDYSLPGIALTQAAAAFHFGDIGTYFIAVAIVLFGFTTILGNTFYGEANISFLTPRKDIQLVFRLTVLAVVVTGSVMEVPVVWEWADLMSATMILINLTSVTLLATIIKRAMSHFEQKFAKTPECGFSFGQIELSIDAPYHFAYDETSPTQFSALLSDEKRIKN